MYRTLIIGLALGLAAVPGRAADPNAEKPLGTWDALRVWPRHAQLRGELMQAIRSGDIPAMEATCRAALEVLPGDATWHYNLACALAYRAQPGLALTELEKAILFGFRDAEAIAKDRDFAAINTLPRFAELVEKARRLAREPVAGRPVVAPCAAAAGQNVTLTDRNVAFDFNIGFYQAMLRLDGTEKGGNAGDLYLNRDVQHSMLNHAEFPAVTFLSYESAACARGLHVDHPNTLFPLEYAVFGNVSRARVSGPFWRSMGRAAITDPGLGARMDTLYRNNQVWFFVAHKDFGHDGIGDAYPAAPPFQFCTLGSSWSDQPFLKAALAASAAFPGDTKKTILHRHLLGPTFQWLFRRTQHGVNTEADYLSARAHDTVFDAKHLDAAALVARAAALDRTAVPPAVSLALVNSRTFPIKYPKPVTDYPDDVSELLLNTPSCIGLVLRAPEGKRTFLFRAQTFPENDPSATFAWRVVKGDPARVKIATPLGETFNDPAHGFAQITIDRRTLTNRLDVACFAKSEGTPFGAPAIISFFPVPQEARTYHADGRIATIDYTNPHDRYSDPAIALPRHWVDVYDYAADGRALGYTRFYNGRQAASFSPRGERILEKNPDGSAKRTVPVRYMARRTADAIQPLELSYVDAEEKAQP